MADKEFYVNINGLGVSQLVGTRIYNVANNIEQLTVQNTGNNGGPLGVENTGYMIYRVDLKSFAIWNGTEFVFQGLEVDGDLIFKGVIDASTSLDAQVEKVSGYQYIVGTAGTLTATGVTFTPSAVAEVGDVFFFIDPTEAYVIQRNDVYATEVQSGNIRLATQAEVNAGVEATEAVTPATLQGKLDGQFYTRQYTATVNIAANTPFAVNHNLGLVNKDAFTVNVMSENGSQISLDVDSVDANSLTLTSLLPLTDVVVTVVGAKSV